MIGACAGIALVATLGTAALKAASRELLTGIAAIVLEGTSLYSGRSSVRGTLLAGLLLGTANSGLTLLNVSSS